jgi:outer membrane protein
MKTQLNKLDKIAFAIIIGMALLLPVLAAASDDAVPVKKKTPPSQAVVTTAQSAPEEPATQEEAQPSPEADEQAAPAVYTLTAEELIKLALDNSFALRIAEKNAESTYYQYLKYAGMAGGSLDLAGVWKRSGPGQKGATITQKETTGTFNASFSYPLAPLGNLGYGKQAAWSGYMASASQVDLTRAQTISGVFSAYVGYLTALNGVKVAEEGMALAEEQLKNAQAKFANDVSPRFEVIQGEVAVSQARENLIQAKNGADLALSALYLAVGITPEVQFKGMDVQVVYAEALDRTVNYITGDVFPKLDAQGIYDVFLEKTPQYYALIGQVGMYHYQSLAYRRAPYFSLDAGYTHLTGFPMSSPNNWSFGVSGKLNLWDAGATEATKNGFRAQADAASLQLEQYEQGFRLNIDSALSTLQTSVEGYQTAQNTLAQATEALRMARLGYREGVVTHADLVGARTAYLGAELNEFSARMSVVTSYQSLLTLLGIGNADLYLPTTTSDLSAITAGVISNEKN